MRHLLTILLLLLPAAATATQPEAPILEASWAMDVPVTGDHAIALIEKVTSQVDQSDFAQGEWRRYKVGISKTTVTLTLLHRYDEAESDFPTPQAGAEEWSMQLSNAAYTATVEWTTQPSDRATIERVYAHDDRLAILPRFSPNPRTAVEAALQHARLDALHAKSNLVGVLRDGHTVWQPAAEHADPARLPRLLIVASGYNQFRSKLGRDATMGPACIGWQNCNEQRGVTAAR